MDAKHALEECRATGDDVRLAQSVVDAEPPT
jgi:hypothetical protein